MESEIIGRIRVNSVYRHHLRRVVLVEGEREVGDVPLGRYIVASFAVDARTGYDCVVYTGLDGADRGRTYVCSLADFAVRMREEGQAQVPPATETAAPIPAAAEKMAGHKSQS